MNKVTPQAGRVVVAAVFALACLIFFFAPQLVSLVFGPNYLDAVTPLRVLLPGIIAMSSYRILVGDLAGRGRPEIGTYSTFIALAATISLDLVLIPSFGITGAALASSIAYSLAAGFMLANYVRITGVSARELFLLRLTDLYSIRESLANRLPLAGRSPEDVT